jgi:hypothetical protein
LPRFSDLAGTIHMAGIPKNASQYPQPFLSHRKGAKRIPTGAVSTIKERTSNFTAYVYGSSYPLRGSNLYLQRLIRAPRDSEYGLLVTPMAVSSYFGRYSFESRTIKHINLPLACVVLYPGPSPLKSWRYTNALTLHEHGKTLEITPFLCSIISHSTN